jgi:hypothetical protein
MGRERLVVEAIITEPTNPYSLAPAATCCERQTDRQTEM